MPGSVPAGKAGDGTADVNPTVARRELAVYFHRLREQRGRTLGELATLLEVAQSQASRLDTGARGFQRVDVERLCEWYGLGAGETDRLLALAEDGRRRAWWQQIDLPDSYRTLIGFEQAADSISEFCGMIVPGLLQTRAYAMAAAESVKYIAKPSEAERFIEVRMRRQAILQRSTPPQLSVVIDEAVLARRVGGVDVMRSQFEHLLERSHRARFTIQVIGFEAGIYPACPPEFMLLDLGARVPAIYYSEDNFTWSDSSDEADVQQMRQLWDLLQAKALSPADSARRIVAHRDQLPA